MLSPLLLCCVGMLLASAAAVQALTVDPGGAARAGTYSSVAIVEGRPAVAYVDDQNGLVKFVRAADADGAAWGPPLTVVSGPDAGEQVCLKIVNGNPAICYYHIAQQRIMFVRAEDAAGSIWNTPVSVPAGPGPPLPRFSLETADGNPAVSFVSSNGKVVRYVRAADASGAGWGTPVTVDAAGDTREVTMKTVDGRPAVACTDTYTLWYCRALDAAGTAWEPRVSVSPVAPDAPVHGVSMQVVNGLPAISYFDSKYGLLKYARATGAAGAAWGAPFFLDSDGHAGSPSSLAVVNGRPAIGYVSRGLTLKYVQASDSDGATAAAWKEPVWVDALSTVWAPALMEVNGCPALAYHDAGKGSLKYLRATSLSAGLQWPAEFIMRDSDHFSRVPDGGMKDFGFIPVGNSAPMRLTLANAHSGSVPINSTRLFFDGPDAAEFSVDNLGLATLNGGGGVQFTVTFLPVKAGRKTAVLHATGTAEGSAVSYAVTITGASLPDIAVEQPGGSPLADGGLLLLPLTAAGAATDFVLTVRNSGTAALQGLVITFDGQDAAEFSVVSGPSPEEVVAPARFTSFTLRHTPAAEGTRTAVLHLASNVTGSQNPFDLTLRTAPGMPDTAFNANVEELTALAVQADGKILIGGVNSLERLNGDGTTDPSFFSPPVTGGTVLCIAIQKDGRILMGGDFNRVGGQPRSGLARLLTDGSLDDAFVTSAGPVVSCLALQHDRKILAGGSLTSPRPWLARLLPDGSQDAGFTPLANNSVLAFALEPDGGILIGGAFTQITGIQATHLARLSPDGIPVAFSAASFANVGCLALQTDGRIFTGGTGGWLARHFPDGALDLSVSRGTNGVVSSLALQADGKCIAGGDFYFFAGVSRFNLGRLHASGSVDDDFRPDPNWTVQQVALQADGRVLIAGRFWSVGGTPYSHLARLGNDPASTELKLEGRSTVRWLRSGSAPEVRDVTFDVKASAAADWTPLGPGTCIPGGWELSGITLPVSGQIRAQAYAGGSVIESVLPILTTLESWRLQHFNTSENTGDAANDADPDHDGLTNFTEFAFGLSPLDRGSNALPDFKSQGTSFTSTFTAPEGRESILYSAEWSPSMLPETWARIPDTGTGENHVFSAPATGERLFVRFGIRVP